MLKRITSVVTAIICLLTFSSVVSAEEASINIGDYIVMGTYYDEPILWRCVDIDENGPLMLSDKILCLKAFDASGENDEGSHGRGYYYNGTQGYYRRIYGSGYWADSNIRDWLNSDASAGNVVWSCGNPPDSNHVWKNAYDNESGFLAGFSSAERNLIKEVTQKSILDGYEYSDSSNTLNPNYQVYDSSISNIVQNYDTAYSEEVTDKVFLLDVKQLNTVYNNLGDYYQGKPTAQCITNSDYTNSLLSTDLNWYYWLRTPNTYDHSVLVRNIYTNNTIPSDDAYLGYNGVRPAFYLNLSSMSYTGGSGTESDPYTVSTKVNQNDEIDEDPNVPLQPETINIGDYIVMGTYYDEPILWRCVDIDENGPLMLSDKILCLKPFDASGENDQGSHGRGYYENGIQGYKRRIYGSSYWADSNIRDWLNSDASAGNVVWSCGNPPDTSHVWNGYNAYDNEAGFLTNFSYSEKNLIKEVTQKAILDGYEYSDSSNTMNPNYHRWKSSISNVVQNYDTAYSEEVTDKVFLLDVKQLNAVYNNLGDYYQGQPTAECVAHSDYTYSLFRTGSNWYYWLRTPNSYNDGSNIMRSSYANGSIDNERSNSGYTGVRPAFYLNLSSLVYTRGEGTEENPYRVSGWLVSADFDTCNYEDNSLTAEIDIEYAYKTCDVYLGIYDNNKLVDLKSHTVAVGDTQKSFIFENIGDCTGLTVKAFFFDGLTPLSEILSRQITYDSE